LAVVIDQPSRARALAETVFEGVSGVAFEAGILIGADFAV
jgi:hypothetical protein